MAYLRVLHEIARYGARVSNQKKKKGSIAETSVKILIITASVLQFLN